MFYPRSILISETEIRQRVQQIGFQISKDFENSDEDLVMLCVLKGSAIFFADLLRAMTIDVRCEFIQISSYLNGTKSSGEIKLIHDLNFDFENKDLLIVEDIVDSGRSVQFLREQLQIFKPSSINVCSLLDKPSGRFVSGVKIDYVGFEVGDQFIVGYGLDYAQRYRNLPYIATLDLLDGDN